jgi:hypothetical protein
MEEFSTETSLVANSVSGSGRVVLERWESLATILPADLEASARATAALVRRRGVRQALDLLRVILLYAWCDWSLRLVGARGVLLGLADLSDVAILNRLRHSTTWLGVLLVQLLQRRRVRLRQQDGVRLRLVDATVVSRPGSRGTDWRVHVSLDLGHLCLDGVEVTSAQGGESLARFPGQPGDIDVADRGYAFVSSLEPDLVAGAKCVVRINWQNLPLQDEEGQRIDMAAWLRKAFRGSVTGTREGEVWLCTSQGRFPLRLVAGALPQEAAERARHRARESAKKKGRTPDQRTLWACGFVLLVTTLPTDSWPAPQVLDLYRIRWQVEMLFKRLKGLLHLDRLRAQDPHLAQTYLLGKILGALMLDALTHTAAQQVSDWFTSLDRPVSPWRLAALLWEQLRHTVQGNVSWETVYQELPRLQRFLCDSPRKRRQQLAHARFFLKLLSAC